MVNEFKHKIVGGDLSQTEWEDVDTHIADGQAIDDMLVATSTTQWSRLAVAASRIIGKKATGTTSALTGAEVLAILSAQAGADFDLNNKKLKNVAAATVNNDVLVKGSRITEAEMMTGTEQGDVLYWSGSVWTLLAHGTSGQALTSGGHAANPSWTTISGSLFNITDDTTVTNTGTTETVKKTLRFIVDDTYQHVQTIRVFATLYASASDTATMRVRFDATGEGGSPQLSLTSTQTSETAASCVTGTIDASGLAAGIHTLSMYLDGNDSGCVSTNKIFQVVGY